MRIHPLLIAALVAFPGLAQAQTASSAQAPSPETIAVPPELTDPAMAEKLGRVMQAMSKAFLNLPVGEMVAAIEGRPVTRADKSQTVRELGRRDDPDFERKLERQIADSKGMMQAGMQAMASALPAMMKGMTEAARELEKATANLPSPNYPKR